KLLSHLRLLHADVHRWPQRFLLRQRIVQDAELEGAVLSFKQSIEKVLIPIALGRGKLVPFQFDDGTCVSPALDLDETQDRIQIAVRASTERFARFQCSKAHDIATRTFCSHYLTDSKWPTRRIARLLEFHGLSFAKITICNAPPVSSPSAGRYDLSDLKCTLLWSWLSHMLLLDYLERPLQWLIA